MDDPCLGVPRKAIQPRGVIRSKLMASAVITNSTFETFGVQPVINACGIYTDLGGSVLSPAVWKAMQEINSSFVRMVDLLDRCGEMLAQLLGAEAARVVPGASAALTLGTAACMSGMNGDAWEQLPDTTGLPNEVIIQTPHRYKYDRMVRIAGGKLITAGTPNSVSVNQVDEAFSSKTAMVLFPAHLDGKPGTLRLRELSHIAKGHGVPLFVDAAYMNYPTSIMHGYLEAGADLVCFSAKYFWGPNSGGVICGRRDLIEAVAGVDFTRYESGPYLTFGRPFKLDRHTVIATVAALQEWFALDHSERWSAYEEKVKIMRCLLSEIPAIKTDAKSFTMDERLIDEPVNCMTVEFPHSSSKAEQACSQLLNGSPSIATMVVDRKLVVAVETLVEGQHIIITERLKQILDPRISYLSSR